MFQKEETKAYPNVNFKTCVTNVEYVSMAVIVGGGVN